MTTTDHEKRLLLQENELLKKRERQFSEELAYTKDKLQRLQSKYDQLQQHSSSLIDKPSGGGQSNSRSRGRSINSSAANTQHIILNNRELVRVIEDKSILERQVDEYKSTLKEQSKLIEGLQAMLHK